jgi:hypothetical protein
MSGEVQSHYGFKRITPTNWSEPDLLATDFGFSAEAWVDAILKPQLSPQVPEEVRALFEAARALFIYSWYFYPMATSGAEQLFRVMEAAARERCRELGLPLMITNASGKSRATNFSGNIRALQNAGQIDAADATRWEATRKLRNVASHPQRQQILPPGMTIRSLVANADLVNRLFR